jgi:hypothetical protein
MLPPAPRHENADRRTPRVDAGWRNPRTSLGPCAGRAQPDGKSTVFKEISLLAAVLLAAWSLASGENYDAVILKAEKAVRQQLKDDPESARFKDVIVDPTGKNVCGWVDYKNKYGEYVGFKSFHFQAGMNFALIFSHDVDATIFCKPLQNTVRGLETPTPRETPPSSTTGKNYDALILKAENAVRETLSDPEAARFKDISVSAHLLPGEKPKVCGWVNAKNKFGGYVGFRSFYYWDGKVTIASGGSPDVTIYCK